MEHCDLPHDHGQNIEDILKNMPLDLDFLNMAQAFKQLSDGTRLKIFWLLCHSEECVCNIAAVVKMSDAAVSHHLQMLKQDGLIVSSRSGKEVYYKLASNNRANLLHGMIDDLFRIVCPNP